MSTEVAPTPTPTSFPALSPIERRVLGVLVEKAKTTPEAYPLSLNAIVTGSNQKSNRDPVMNVTDEDVEHALTHLQQKGLVTKITGSRVDRWRHNLYEQWNVGKVELAILAELLLRGPQTEGELRGRASRMEAIDELEVLRNHLRQLRDRHLVVFLGEEGRRGTQVTHGFHEPEEMDWLLRQPRTARAEAVESVAAAALPASDRKREIDEIKAEIAQLHSMVADLQSTVARLLDEINRVPKREGPP